VDCAAACQPPTATTSLRLVSMEPTRSAYTPEDIRELIVRRELAASRQRRAVAKQLGLDDTEAEALAIWRAGAP
jgi:hypothetical protein